MFGKRREDPQGPVQVREWPLVRKHRRSPLWPDVLLSIGWRATEDTVARHGWSVLSAHDRSRSSAPQPSRARGLWAPELAAWAPELAATSRDRVRVAAVVRDQQRATVRCVDRPAAPHAEGFISGRDGLLNGARRFGLRRHSELLRKDGWIRPLVRV